MVLERLWWLLPWSEGAVVSIVYLFWLRVYGTCIKCFLGARLGLCEVLSFETDVRVFLTGFECEAVGVPFRYS